MERTKMTFAEFIRQDIDIDVCDEIDADFYIGFTGPAELTDEGKEHFAPVLELEVFVEQDEKQPSMALATVMTGGCWDWRKKLEQVEDFFEAAAGYCSEANYKKWFKE